MLLCVPINKTKFQEVYDQVLAAQDQADVIEIWFDEITDLDSDKIEQLFQAAKKPILYKTTANNELFNQILSHNPAYLDLDINDQRQPQLNRTELIISYHNFEETPAAAELQNLAHKMLKRGADILKFATQANSFADSLNMLAFLNKISPDQRSICICMGQHGQITRCTGHLLGNYLMFTPMDEADRSAPGQITLSEQRQIQELI